MSLPDTAPTGSAGRHVVRRSRLVFVAMMALAVLAVPLFVIGMVTGELWLKFIFIVPIAGFALIFKKMSKINRRTFAELGDYLQRPGWQPRADDQQVVDAILAYWRVVNAQVAAQPGFPAWRNITATFDTRFGPVSIANAVLTAYGWISPRFGPRPGYTYVWATLPHPLPPLVISPQLQNAAPRSGDVDIESEQFNRRFRVSPGAPVNDLVAYRRFVYAVLTPRAIEALVPSPALKLVVSGTYVCAISPTEPETIEINANAVAAFAAAVSPSVYQEYGVRRTA